MTLQITDPDVEQAVRHLAQLKGKSPTETIREAVAHEHAALTARATLRERLQPLQARFQSLRRPGGQPADKAFFDSLSGEP